MANTKQTSVKEASKVLRDSKSTPSEKRLAGSDLSQARGSKKK